jgi:hypothetical protein
VNFVNSLMRCLLKAVRIRDPEDFGFTADRRSEKEMGISRRAGEGLRKVEMRIIK